MSSAPVCSCPYTHSLSSVPHAAGRCSDSARRPPGSAAVHIKQSLHSLLLWAFHLAARSAGKCRGRGHHGGVWAVKIRVRAAAALFPQFPPCCWGCSTISWSSCRAAPAALGAGSCLVTTFCSKSGHPATELSTGAVLAATPNHIPWEMPAVRPGTGGRGAHTDTFSKGSPTEHGHIPTSFIRSAPIVLGACLYLLDEDVDFSALSEANGRWAFHGEAACSGTRRSPTASCLWQPRRLRFQTKLV